MSAFVLALSLMPEQSRARLRNLPDWQHPPQTSPCPKRYGYQSSCLQREFMSTAQASVLRVPLADGTLVETSDLPPKELIPSLLATSECDSTTSVL